MADEKKTEKAAKGDKGDKKEKKPKKGKGEDRGGRSAAMAPVVSNTEAIPPRFAAKYAKEAAPSLIKQFSYKNPNQVPKLEKIVVNMGLGQAVTNPKIIDSAVDELKALTGQKPVVTRSKKAIASFKLRRFKQSARVREDAIFHTDDKNNRELKTLGGVQRHQIDDDGFFVQFISLL